MSYYNLPQLARFRFWCQKVLPLVYDDSLSYYEVLAKVVKHLNLEADAINEITDILEGSGIDIDEAVEKVIEALEETSTLQDACEAAVEAAVEDGLIDPRIESVVGDMITDGDFDDMVAGLTQAKLTCYDTFGDIPTSGLNIGDMAQTKGFYSVNDGGAGLYMVTATGYPSNATYNFTILSEVTSKNLGLKNDGSASVSSALNSAIAIYPKIKMLNGNYLVDSQINVVTDRCIEGEENTRFTRQDNNDIYILNVTNAARITIRNIKFYGGEQTDTSYMVNNNTCSYLEYENCEFYNSYGYALKFGVCNYVTVKGLKFNTSTGAVGNPGGCVYVHGGNTYMFDSIYAYNIGDHILYIDGQGNNVNNVTISNIVGRSWNSDNLTSGSAIVLAGGVYDVSIDNVVLYRVGAGIYIGYRDGLIPAHISVSNVTINTTLYGPGIYVLGDSDTRNTSTGITITGCSIYSAAGAGVLISDTREVSISNVLVSTSSNGFILNDADYITMFGCYARTIENNGYYVGRTTACYDCSLVGCVADDVGQGFWLKQGSRHYLMNCVCMRRTEKSFDIRTSETVVMPSEITMNGLRSVEYGSAAPTYGYHTAGDLCINNTGSTSLGWKCTVSGTPGTWAAIE